MERIVGIENIESAPSCVAFGAFDGVHLGHQAVLRRMVEQARGGGMRSVALTFDPHPDAVLRPGRPPPLLTTLEEKAAAIETCGPEVLVVARFDRELAAMAAEHFVRRVLAEAIGARYIVVGPDAVFGRRGEGGVALLRRLGAGLGMPQVEQVGPTVVGGRQVSSTAIRELLGQGDAASGRDLLGRPYPLGGVVVRGRGRGESLGFATLNLDPDDGKLIPQAGVYAGWADAAGERRAAALSIGERATFATLRSPDLSGRSTSGEPDLAIEAHLLDFSGELYGQRVVLHFWERLRDQERFESAEALREQMAEDCQRAAAALEQPLHGG